MEKSKQKNIRETIEDARVNRSLTYGLLIGTLSSLVPPIILPVETREYDGSSIYRHKDSNVMLYSLSLGYTGLVLSIATREYLSRKKAVVESWIVDRTHAQIQEVYKKEDSRQHNIYSNNL